MDMNKEEIIQMIKAHEDDCLDSKKNTDSGFDAVWYSAKLEAFGEILEAIENSEKEENGQR
jgi:hypothetical protein